MIRNLLLLSSSKTPTDPERLHHAEPWIRSFLQNDQRVVKKVTLVPYAGVMPPDEYVGLVRPAFDRLGIAVESVHEGDDPFGAIRRAEAICVGGGNTYVLTHWLHWLHQQPVSDDDYDLGDLIAERVLLEGVPYIGWSAGANMAFGGIETTNDMNVVRTDKFDGLGLIGGTLRLNPHYSDPLSMEALPPEISADIERLQSHPAVAMVLNPQGESRAYRLREYLRVNRGPVIALYEGAILLVEGTRMALTGTAGAKIFYSEDLDAMKCAGISLGTLLRDYEGYPPIPFEQLFAANAGMAYRRIMREHPKLLEDFNGCNITFHYPTGEYAANPSRGDDSNLKAMVSRKMGVPSGTVLLSSRSIGSLSDV